MVVTDETVVLNPMLVALAGTVTVDGTVAAALLLERFTGNPALGAAPLRVTVHASVPAPDMETLVQVSVLNAAMPDPLMLTTAEGLAEELLVMVSVPVNVLTWGAEN